MLAGNFNQTGVDSSRINKSNFKVNENEISIVNNDGRTAGKGNMTQNIKEKKEDQYND